MIYTKTVLCGFNFEVHLCLKEAQRTKNCLLCKTSKDLEEWKTREKSTNEYTTDTANDAIQNSCSYKQLYFLENYNLLNKETVINWQNNWLEKY